ncbi:hypothetical protein TIFTF001_014854 [Ficus carica]|uniref:RING-type E3 ubiquitin transferase n=1 Tax=Ficus carica TaxID=3494 RepID=A0AA88D4I3_FICCA|nr:hypothetical protein TIFTF001_014854 [Ficus carica]
MAGIHSPQVIGAPIVTVTPIYDVLEGEHFLCPELENLMSTTFLFNIKVKLTRPASHSVDGEGRIVFDAGEGPGRSVEFSKSFSSRFDALVGATARDDIASMLSEAHVPETLRSDYVVDKIQECGRRLPEGRTRRPNSHCVMTLNVDIEAFVDERRPSTASANENNNNNGGDNDNDNDNGNDNDNNNDDELTINPDEDVFDGEGDEAEPDPFDDYDVCFEQASEESIERLEKVRVLGEKAVNCSVCLENVVVGTEAIRLPCSHLFHGDCIVTWLRRSKFCPLCSSRRRHYNFVVATAASPLVSSSLLALPSLEIPDFCRRQDLVAEEEVEIGNRNGWLAVIVVTSSPSPACIIEKHSAVSFLWDELKVGRRLVAVGWERRYVGAFNVQLRKSYGALTFLEHKAGGGRDSDWVLCSWWNGDDASLFFFFDDAFVVLVAAARGQIGFATKINSGGCRAWMRLETSQRTKERSP